MHRPEKDDFYKKLLRHDNVVLYTICASWQPMNNKDFCHYTV